jgi:putative transposon-encoded protein
MKIKRRDMDALPVEQQIVKSIGTSGQISLGKEFAGRKVLVENPEPGVWVIRTVTIIPDNERWLHQPSTAKKLDSALAWANQNLAKASNPDQLPLPKAYAPKRKTRTA